MSPASSQSLELDIDSLVDAALGPQGARGRPRTPPSFLRDVQLEDLPALSGMAVDPGRKPLEKVRTTHHLAARCIAEGKSDIETAYITGYTPTRISMFKSDPTFRELIAYYKSQVEAKWLNVQERLAALSIAFTEEIQQRLDEVPDTFSNEEIRRWSETLLDRSGNGPSATRNVNVNSKNVTLNLIEKIKSESSDSAQVKLLAAE